MRAEGGWSLGGVEVSLAVKVLAEYKEPSERYNTQTQWVTLEYGQSEGVWLAERAKERLGLSIGRPCGCPMDQDARYHIRKSSMVGPKKDPVVLSCSHLGRSDHFWTGRRKETGGCECVAAIQTDASKE